VHTTIGCLWYAKISYLIENGALCIENLQGFKKTTTFTTGLQGHIKPFVLIMERLNYFYKDEKG